MPPYETHAVSSVAERRLQTLSKQLLHIELSPCASSGPQPSTNSPLLAGQVAIITGAGKGIGEATARLLSAHGAAIVVCDLDKKAADLVTEGIRSAGGRAVSVQADVTAADAPQRIVDAALGTFGGIHIIVNNAGFTWDGVVHKMSPEQWQAMLDVHCTAPFRLLQAAAPHLREAAKKEAETDPLRQARPRSVVNISSTSGTHGNGGQANYSTAKAGVVGLTKSIAKEWGPLNIRCNALAYGLIDTRLTRAKEQGESISVGGKQVALGIPGGSQYWSAVKSSIPLQRVGSVEEAAGAILLLVSPWASYITGQVIEVNGGAFM